MAAGPNADGLRKLFEHKDSKSWTSLCNDVPWSLVTDFDAIRVCPVKESATVSLSVEGHGEGPLGFRLMVLYEPHMGAVAIGEKALLHKKKLPVEWVEKLNKCRLLMFGSCLPNVGLHEVKAIIDVHALARDALPKVCDHGILRVLSALHSVEYVSSFRKGGVAWKSRAGLEHAIASAVGIYEAYKSLSAKDGS